MDDYIPLYSSTSSVEPPREYDTKEGTNKKTIAFMRTCQYLPQYYWNIQL